jgi:hypothetical protein
LPKKKNTFGKTGIRDAKLTSHYKTSIDNGLTSLDASIKEKKDFQKEK